MTIQTNIRLFREVDVETKAVIATAKHKLAEASQMVEAAAYEIAGEVGTDRVARLMLLAAELERICQTLERPGAYCPSRSSS